MQLILSTESTVDIKAKMSNKEDDHERSTLDVHSAVANGNVANGDIATEDKEPSDSNKNSKLEQVKENAVKSTDHHLEQVKCDVVSNNADIQTSHVNDNDINEAVDVIIGKDDSKNNESVEKKITVKEIVTEETEHNLDSNITPKTETNDANAIADASENEPVEEERNENSSNSATTHLKHVNSTDISTAGENESVTTEKVNIDIVDSNTEAKLKDENMTVSSISDAGESLTVEKEDTSRINTEVEVNNEKCALNNIADINESTTTENELNDTAIINTEAELNDEPMLDSTITGDSNADAIATESVTVEKENNDVDIDTETEASIKKSSTNVTVDHDNNDTNICNVNNTSREASPNINVDHGNSDATKIMPEAELNIVSSTIEESGNVSIPIENISNEKQIDDFDMIPEVDSTNDEVKKDSEESIITATSNTEVRKENVLIVEINNESNEIESNISASVENVSVEIDETDMSDESIDLINLNITKDSEDKKECDKKGIEEDPEEKETSKAANNDASKPESMDVDESAEKDKKLETNSEVSVHSFAEVNKSSDSALSVDCNINETITTQKDETENVVPDSSDDIIFNLDDDREQESDSIKPDAPESTEVIEDDDKTVFSCDDDKEKSDSVPVSKQSDEIIDLDENVPKDVEERKEKTSEKTVEEPKIPPVLKLSNTLDILSDEEDEIKETNADSKCINIEDDDDIMLIDEETSGNEMKNEAPKETEKEKEEPKPKTTAANTELSEESKKIKTDPTTETEAEEIPEKEVVESMEIPEINEKVQELKSEKENTTPLLHEKFLKACKKNLSDMTREEVEEFCILKIVESVIDRSSVSEVKSKLKSLTQNIDEYSKKAKMLMKQNRDLQVVLKSIQEDQKKGTDSIVPLKITRSVGMQVLMSDKVVQRRKGIGLPSVNAPANKGMRNPVIQSPRPQTQKPPQIPVPRLVPANNPTLKSPIAQPPNTGKITSPLPNGIKNPSPVQKGEKRSHNRMQSVTVDLTDDEPPTKMVNRALSVSTPAVPPVRLVPSQNLLAPPRPTTVNSPRKVYIPISGPQGQGVRPGQTIMLKTVPNPSPRQRCPPPHMVRMPQNMRMQRPQGMRHPAPLPDCMKQYQPPNWKALPPAPDLKLAKVENGIVISWKIEGYQEDSYEEIASYQLYAYQETASPPNTALWKKIGDVKALPLPMACTLTQFMAGYKYYFAVRAVDVRSRLGPFSLPGSILLLNKM